MSTASMTKSTQPTKSSSGARVAVHGAPPFTCPVRRADFFATRLPAPSSSVQVVTRRAAKGAGRAAPDDGGLEADLAGREPGAPAFVNELAGQGGLRLGLGGESQPGDGERGERGDHSHGTILRHFPSAHLSISVPFLWQGGQSARPFSSTKPLVAAGRDPARNGKQRPVARRAMHKEPGQRIKSGQGIKPEFCHPHTPATRHLLSMKPASALASRSSWPFPHATRRCSRQASLHKDTSAMRGALFPRPLMTDKARGGDDAHEKRAGKCSICALTGIQTVASRGT